MTVAPEKLLAVEAIRVLDQLPGRRGRVTQIASGRQARRQVTGALRLAARERLVETRDGLTFQLTAKAIAMLHPETA